MLELEKNMLLNTPEGSSAKINCCIRACEYVYSPLLTENISVGSRSRRENQWKRHFLRWNREECVFETPLVYRFEAEESLSWAALRPSLDVCGTIHVQSGNQIKAPQPVFVSQERSHQVYEHSHFHFIKLSNCICYLPISTHYVIRVYIPKSFFCLTLNVPLRNFVCTSQHWKFWFTRFQISRNSYSGLSQKVYYLRWLRWWRKFGPPH